MRYVPAHQLRDRLAADGYHSRASTQFEGPRGYIITVERAGKRLELRTISAAQAELRRARATQRHQPGLLHGLLLTGIIALAVTSPAWWG